MAKELRLYSVDFSEKWSGTLALTRDSMTCMAKDAEQAIAKVRKYRLKQKDSDTGERCVEISIWEVMKLHDPPDLM
jgi:hypothetical protein